MPGEKKHSKKREAILAKIRSMKTHPSAITVYEELRKEIPDLSLGTVYRNLALFREEGKVVSVGVVNGQERFDGNTMEHTHFVCTLCGDVMDIDVPLDKNLKDDIADRYGITVYSHRLTFFGECARCAPGP
ncbi:MAG TPA: transcriptional repressor [Papillibacter sp.]|jgi:Fur family peroxide stress response transcriptional regulator|nr:transcriptional repressor [Papillibacter sp.]